MEDSVGMPGLFQRHALPTPPVTLHTGTTNHIRIDHSVVGAINTGNIEKLDVVMDRIKAGGDDASAEELKKMVQAVVDNTDIQIAAKNEILEHLAFISSQAIIPKENRQTVIAKTSVIAVEKLLSTSADLLTIWTGIKPLIETFLT
jgi:hypothetical protein